MSESALEEKIELYEHYFRDPKVGDGYLKRPARGLAVRNIRAALEWLGYPLKQGDVYDEDLSRAVRKFQEEQEHRHKDGVVGKGTRLLLTRAMILAGREGIFERVMVSPEYAVFLSYSRADEQAVAGLAAGIRAMGIGLFRDKETIPGGAAWPDVLFRSIRKCRVFLCMLSPPAAASVNILIEAALARHAEKPIIPVLLEAAQLPHTLQLLIGNHQQIDLTGKIDPQTALHQILDALSNYGLVPYIEE